MNIAKLKKLFAGPKAIFAILGLILVVEVFYAASVLLSPSSSLPQPVPEEVNEKTSGRISLSSDVQTVKVGETLRVSANIETGGHSIDGADLIVRYDPKILEATPGGLIKGEILDEYPLLSLDAKSGVISISGISSLRKGYEGSGEFAAILFKAKAPGKTEIEVDFEKGSTTDSNLVENSASKDILDSVDNIEFNIN